MALFAKKPIRLAGNLNPPWEMLPLSLPASSPDQILRPMHSIRGQSPFQSMKCILDHGNFIPMRIVR
ncbi:MAG: hypothetical protein EBU27_03600, partial [Opitutae bacterium]|nr:hypothetical protein [Opitutae bacterium]